MIKNLLQSIRLLADGKRRLFLTPGWKLLNSCRLQVLDHSPRTVLSVSKLTRTELTNFSTNLSCLLPFSTQLSVTIVSFYLS